MRHGTTYWTSSKLIHKPELMKKGYCDLVFPSNVLTLVIAPPYI